MSLPNKSGAELEVPKELIDDKRWALVLRIAASEEFRRSARLRDFLLFICKRTLQEHREEVHEQNIGFAVFGRRADYDPAEDNIVRVEARELRKRLEQYFAVRGKDEPFEIIIPKGAYVPSFEARNKKPWEAVLLSQPQASVVPNKPATSTNLIFSPSIRWPARLLTHSALGVLLVAMAFGFWQLAVNHKPQTLVVVSTGTVPAPQNILWSRLFDPSHETYLVASDATWYLLKSLVGREFSLDDYVSSGYLSSLNTPQLKIIAAGRYTDMADIIVLTGILNATAPFHAITEIRFARNISIEDLRSNNFVLLGSSASNPWGELFNSMRNFQRIPAWLPVAPVTLTTNHCQGSQLAIASRSELGAWTRLFVSSHLCPISANRGTV